MIEGLRVLTLVPARSGSIGMPIRQSQDDRPDLEIF
jgi:hypothetical protein